MPLPACRIPGNVFKGGLLCSYLSHEHKSHRGPKRLFNGIVSWYTYLELAGITTHYKTNYIHKWDLLFVTILFHNTSLARNMTIIWPFWSWHSNSQKWWLFCDSTFHLRYDIGCCSGDLFELEKMHCLLSKKVKRILPYLPWGKSGLATLAF